MPTLFGVKPLDLINFSRELASLLSSGIALRPALSVLHELTEKRALKDAIRSVMRDIEAGLPFSEACSKQSSVFSPFYTRLIQVAEETGELRKILLEIVGHMERQRALVGKIRKALTYPSIVLAVGLIGAFILVTFAVPAITGLLVEYQAEMPFITRVLVNVGSFSQAYGKHVFLITIVLAVLGWLYVRTERGRKRWDSLILKVPLLGKIIQQNQMTRLCSNLATLLSAGLPTAEALRLSIGVTDNSVFREGLSEVYRQVSTGSRLEPAILAQGTFPRLFSQTVGIAEETGTLRTNLEGLSNFYEQETDRVTTRLTEMIEPALIIVVGMVVGFAGAAIVSAIYSIIPQIK
jgi:type IV pilus assembly protein PilC